MGPKTREITLLSRDFLEACLEERLSQEGPIDLDFRQRKFLEWVAASATFSNVIVVPKVLLEAFLAENAPPSSVDSWGRSYQNYQLYSTARGHRATERSHRFRPFTL